MKIQKITLPTPFYIGPINTYLIEDDPLTIIDTGPKTEEALASLRLQLLRRGHRLEDIKRIIITHTHEDHYGLANTIRRASGAEVYIHSWEARRLTSPDDYHIQRRFMQRAGVPPEIIEAFEAGYRMVISKYADAIPEVKPLNDDEEMVFSTGSLRVIHTPGHTPGSICLFRESNRLLLTADTVLKRITPNPVMNADPFDQTRRFQSLSEYLCSLARLRNLAPTHAMTGHGEDITDYEELFNRMLKKTRERQLSLLSLLPKQGATAWEMAERMFPDAEGVHLFLALSEASANLDLAVADGKARVEQRMEMEVFFPA